MKTSRLLALLLASSMLLAGCGNNKENTKPSDPVTPVTPEPDKPEKTWSASELQIFEDHFYGIEVPYHGIEDAATLQWQNSSNIAILNGGSGTADALNAYDAKFTTDTGWSAVAQAPEHVFAFTKTVQDATQVGHTIMVQFTALDSQNQPAESGTFAFAMMEMSSPASGWTEDELQIFEDHLRGIEVPYIAGAQVIYDDNHDSVYIGGIQVDGADLDAIAEQFGDADWLYDYDTSVPTLEHNYTLSGTKTEGNITYYINGYLFAVDESAHFADEGTLMIELYDEGYDSFDELPLDGILADLGSTATIPSLECSYCVPFYDDGIFDIYLYNVDSTVYATYEATLADSWAKADEESYGSNAYVAPTNDLVMALSYDEDSKIAIMTLYPYSVEPETTYALVKVTEAPADWSGNYVIIYTDSEGNNLVMNGGLASLDATSNYITASVDDEGNMVVDQDILDAMFVVEPIEETTNYSIKSVKNNYYFGRTSDSNGLETSTTEAMENAFALLDDGSVDIVSGGAHLRFNKASNQMRFRYYKASSYANQQSIYLYEVVEVA